MEQVPTDKKQRMPSSRVLEEVIHQAPADYFTVGWLTSTLQQRSFGIVMLFLGLLAMIDLASHAWPPPATAPASPISMAVACGLPSAFQILIRA
jgi:Exopolysaccharide synthesis, ExoD